MDRIPRLAAGAAVGKADEFWMVKVSHTVSINTLSKVLKQASKMHSSAQAPILKTTKDFGVPNTAK